MYTLVWTLEARIDLATVWIDATDRAAVNQAADQAEAILRSYPFGQAVHVSEGLWRLVVRPLVVHFAVDTSTRTVTISQVATVA
jgi:hypothetical protein